MDRKTAGLIFFSFLQAIEVEPLSSGRRLWGSCMESHRNGSTDHAFVWLWLRMMSHPCESQIYDSIETSRQIKGHFSNFADEQLPHCVCVCVFVWMCVHKWQRKKGCRRRRQDVRTTSTKKWRKISYLDPMSSSSRYYLLPPDVVLLFLPFHFWVSYYTSYRDSCLLASQSGRVTREAIFLFFLFAFCCCLLWNERRRERDRSEINSERWNEKMMTIRSFAGPCRWLTFFERKNQIHSTFSSHHHHSTLSSLLHPTSQSDFPLVVSWGREKRLSLWSPGLLIFG